MKIRVNRLILAAIFCGILFSLVQTELLSAEGLEERTEEEFIFSDNVTGVTKRPEKTYEAAANVTVIPGKFLERYAIRNINDLFEVIEGGWHTFKGTDEVLALRGVSGYANDKVLFLYDGMLFPTFLGLGENNWPNTFDDVERIEIIKGPSTSIWGGQGTQGTINIIHKGPDTFQGLNTSIVLGEYGMSRYNVNYSQNPSEDLSYQFLINSTYYKGAVRVAEEWGSISHVRMDGANLANPLPDYQIFTNINYKDFTIAYRRLEERVAREHPNADGTNRTKYVENYADDLNVVIKKPEIMKNTDWTTTIRFNNFYQMYDVFRFKANDDADSYELKSEKRYEIDSSFLLIPNDKLNIVLGAQASIWSPQGSGPVVSWNPVTRNWDPNVAGTGNLVDPPEYLPTLTEMSNDVAATEIYIDAKYKLNDKVSLTGGGRYVSEFNPGDQFRDEREKMHQFFPKSAFVYNPLENLYFKAIYEQAFTRLNTNERYSEYNNINKRGSQKATTSESTELVVDWKPIKNMKVLASYYQAILYDFVNFVYVGPGWPTIRPNTGDLRGFFNVGDQQVRGLEANISYDWKNMGGFISGSQLLKNKIANIVSGLAGGTGVIDTEIDSDFNKSAVPRYNIALGAYCDFTDQYSISGVYKVHQKIQVRGDRAGGGWSGYNFNGGTQLDLAGTAKNVLRENLNLSVIGKNVFNAHYLSGSSLDPGHMQEINPCYYEVKVSYLW
ncbi:MAG: TonB-dependent receptor plug domain-containing protein [bacterium]|nr:TonB-dependent receptor plug domain-containing protein [bacterium]MDD5756420.1 TonB-dependent receptor plug domain-containing protein [bacterium]